MGEIAHDMNIVDIPLRYGKETCSADHTTASPPRMAIDIPTTAPTADTQIQVSSKPRHRVLCCKSSIPTTTCVTHEHNTGIEKG
jgi:hypothetical protein